jgi:hypothetical protein
MSGGIVLGSNTTISFEHKQVPSNVRVLWDLDNDGDFDDPLEDITSYVLTGETFTGRDWPSQLTGKAGAGRATVMLNNADDRFSYFNTASPLNQGDLSLKTGRRFRFQTVEATSPDPVLITKDRFRRADGALNATETGIPWVAEIAPGFAAPALFEIVGEEALATDSTGFVEHLASVDIGVTDTYVQVTHGKINGGAFAAIYYRFQDTNNHGMLFRASSGHMQHIVVQDGVGIASDSFGSYPSRDNYTEGATFGIHVNGSTVTVYLEGVPIGTADAAPFAATKVGMSVAWPSYLTYRPGIRSFHAWNGLPIEVEGILWTGSLADVVPSVRSSGEKIATVTAEGILSTLATVDVTPEPAVIGTTTGLAVGHVLAKAELAHPPGRLQTGDVTTGPHGFARQKALGLARQFEETELGFLYESQEGYPVFEARTARDSSFSVATFSDRPGTQFAYEAITPRDWRREILNRVQAGVAVTHTTDPIISDLKDSDSNGTAGGVANDVDPVQPTVGRGDLLIGFVTSTVGYATTVPWLEPIWWRALRTTAANGRQRVYAHICDGTETGDTVLFYDDTTNSGGEWHCQWFVIPHGYWYGSLDGVSLAEHVPGNNPPALVTPWGLEPTLFFVTYAGLVSLFGGSLHSDLPKGYGWGTGTFLNGASNAFDLFQNTGWKIDINAVEDPTEFPVAPISEFSVVECSVLAVRGFNGSPIPQSGVTTVDLEDAASQDEHNNMIRTHTGPNLFRHTGDAHTYTDRVLGRYGDDRPIFQIEFTATKSAAYRAQAMARRLTHRIRLQADGNAGFGVDSDYHIESITNRFDDGVTNWRVAWELAPAVDVVRADTTSSELADALAAGDAGTVSVFDVDVVEGPLWITDAEFPNMFPFRAVCGSERLLVTGITGATSPQTWTAERADNGFPEAHSAGTAIHLFDQWILP